MSLITGPTELHLFVLKQRSGHKRAEEYSSEKQDGLVINGAVFLLHPGNSVFSLSLKEFINTNEVVDSSHEGRIHFLNQMLSLSKRKIFHRHTCIWWRNLFRGSISLDDVESPVKVDRFIKQTTKEMHDIWPKVYD